MKASQNTPPDEHLLHLDRARQMAQQLSESERPAFWQGYLHYCDDLRKTRKNNTRKIFFSMKNIDTFIFTLSLNSSGFWG